MSTIEIKIPAMGEGIIEATIIKWHVKPGDFIKQDDVVCDIATDKVDSEITAPADGRVDSLLFKENDIVAVGKTIAILKTMTAANETFTNVASEQQFQTVAIPAEQKVESTVSQNNDVIKKDFIFLSPLVKRMVQENNISHEELSQIHGSGIEGRITKDDILLFLSKKSKNITTSVVSPSNSISQPINISANDTLVEMDRVRKLIAEHMVRSKQTSAHVTSFVEVDVSHIVAWREANKMQFQQKHGINITYLPFFIDATIKAILDYPIMNASVVETKIIIHKAINLGIATALPNDNLIVPVIKNAEQLNMVGIVKSLNDLAQRARANQLKPDEIQGGTFSITNLGTFGTLAGTPIINQPQVAILGIGTIRKMPAVIETPQGDAIGIRHKVILSLAYDHRIIDGMLAGKFLNKLTYTLEHLTFENL
ncbi:MAG: 2-oxo acid dehydrogenase subunit E2 [Bacteroidales bacterium]|nr:2-oxo acid dehydrogenase subunit E2 [Bacteroidales bacterium]